ncbi:hypothetical protein WOC68_03545 [Staphylococcus aureus]
MKQHGIHRMRINKYPIITHTPESGIEFVSLTQQAQAMYFELA